MTEQELREMKLHEIKTIEDGQVSSTIVRRVVGGWIYIVFEHQNFTSNSVFVPDNISIYDLISEMQATVQFIRNKF